MSHLSHCSTTAHNHSWKNNRVIYYVIFIGIALLSLINRDLTPVNELKYISIALESLNGQHLFTFYNHGEIYADKPPFYFWIVMLGIKMFGVQGGIIWSGLFSILPMVGICEIFYRWTRSELQPHIALIATLALLTSTLFFISGLVLRMDMLMAFFICLSLFHFYQAFERHNKNLPVGILPYLTLLSILLATFIKGPVGLMLPILSIVIFLISKRQLRSFFCFFPLKGLLAFIIICMAWLYAVYLEGGTEYLYDLTIGQAVKRGVNASIHREPIYYYLKSAIAALQPWTFLLIAGFISTWKNRATISNQQSLFITVSLTGLMMLSFVSSKLEIYFLPLVPFIVFTGFIGLQKASLKKTTHDAYWKWGLYPIAFITTILSVVAPLFFSKALAKLPVQINDLYWIFAILFTTGVSTLILLKKNHFQSACRAISLGVFSIIFAVALLVPKYNEVLGVKALAQEAQTQYQQYGEVGYYTYRYSTGQNMDVYLKQNVTTLDSPEELLALKPGSVIITKRNHDDLLQAFSDNQQTPTFVTQIDRYSVVVK